MKPTLDLIGTAAGFLGTVTCILALVLRIIGNGAPDFMRVQPAHVCLFGISLLAFACWVKLEAR